MTVGELMDRLLDFDREAEVIVETARDHGRLGGIQITSTAVWLVAAEEEGGES